MAASIDQNIKSISLHKSIPVVFHGYVLPFIVLYSVWLYFWTIVYGVDDYWEAGLIALAIIGILQILVCLFCYWSVHIRARLASFSAVSIQEAEFVKVIPTANNGSTEMVNVHKQDGMVWFVFQKIKYVYDASEKKQFSAVEFPISETIGYYARSKGLDNPQITNAMTKYQNNALQMDIPPFMELFIERATAPFFVFQVFCVGLWCLDEYWYYSLFTLFMLIAFEGTLVQQQIRNMAMIREMGNKPYRVQVYRNAKWISLNSDFLLPGDIVSIGRSKDDNPIPCDILLLKGSCIVDESMLTGESVPVMKESIEDLDKNAVLDLTCDSKLRLLFGGTRVVQHSPPPKGASSLKAPDNGCIGYVVRTGFNSSQGTLLRTILFSVKRVTANNLEAFLFILFLLMFAIAASSYVWIKGTEDPTRNKYKLFLECTLILTSVVPPELPIELSLAVNSSLLALVKLSVYCTEPFRIPFAGKIDICCFDKTGTLTSDDLIVEGLAGIGDSPQQLISLDSAPVETIRVLATCQAIVVLEDGELVGDPMERVTLKAIQWNPTKSDGVSPSKSAKVKTHGMKIFHRHHFSSALKRMSVIAGYQPSGSIEHEFIAAVKGAPETLQSMFREVPEFYEKTYLSLARRGARVIALGYKSLGKLDHSQIRELSREEVERDLVFCGFIALSCPLKSDSKSAIKEIQHSSHYVCMITGDNPLTACHIAGELRMTKKPHTLILTEPQTSAGSWQWKSVDATVSLDVSSSNLALLKSHDLCVTGEGLVYLQSKKLDQKLIPCTAVFARVTPKQKELVITTMKDLGYVTLMCGDGTNDVAALKHADVGVALLSAIAKPKKDSAAVKDATASTEPASRNGALVKAIASSGPTPSRAANRRAVARGADNVHPTMATRKRMEKMLEDMEELENTVVKLGDASIASPFTSKYSTIQSVCHIIKQGRCTLVTTLQMFKILALNALVLAYTQSVLFLDGIKFSDTQATMQGLLLAGCFLFISRSSPLKTLSEKRPLTNIFNMYTISSVASQFAVHFCSLVYLSQQAHARMPPREEEFLDLEKKFEPNLLNSTMYLISMSLQLSTVAVNYKGRPFMVGLQENKPLFYSLLTSGAAIAILASGLSPEFTEWFELVELPTNFRDVLVAVLAADFLGAYIADKICVFLFERSKEKDIWSV
ncbi:endoplasmic reticulum transmembrane helix translocase-like [Watersipora subatra]|uniref:endoplasmic reticulum transmembrane helix translocase-like n=1 Tax=Watersipora subatra TaxID=2589382 RepID=UPI00355C45D7